MSKCIPPYTPLLYSKTGVGRGTSIFLIFDPKHRLWVPTINVLSKHIKIIKFFSNEIFKEKILCILHGQVFITLLNKI